MSDTPVAEYDLLYVTQTAKAVGVKRAIDEDVIWLPKSQIRYEEKEYKRNSIILLTIPNWLAEEHDLA